MQKPRKAQRPFPQYARKAAACEAPRRFGKNKTAKLPTVTATAACARTPTHHTQGFLWTCCGWPEGSPLRCWPGCARRTPILLLAALPAAVRRRPRRPTACRTTCCRAWCASVWWWWLWLISFFCLRPGGRGRGQVGGSTPTDWSVPFAPEELLEFPTAKLRRMCRNRSSRSPLTSSSL